MKLQGTSGLKSTRSGCPETCCHLLQEAGDVLLAALGPGQWAGIVLELAGHEVRVPAHGLTVILFPVMLDAKAARRQKAQEY